MKRPDGILVMAAVVVAVLLVGEFISYGPGTYVSESEVILDEDGYNIVLDTNYSTEYTVLVTETDANGEPRHLYIYRDFDYASFIEDSYLDYWIEKMAAEFEAYNFTDPRPRSCSSRASSRTPSTGRTRTICSRRGCPQGASSTGQAPP